MTDRFTLRRVIPVDAIQFTNNEFESSINGWDQISGGSDKSFVWNNPSSIRAGGGSVLANTSAIGQGRPDFTDRNWTPGTYTIEITATNLSTGGSEPFTTNLVLYGSETGSALDDEITFSGLPGWNVGAGEITREITFTLSQEYKKLFFKFEKSGSDTGYDVDFIIDSIVLTKVNDVHDDLEIAEPGGWANHTIKLERHKEFHSIIETLFSNERFIFIGNNVEDGDGGIDFIKEVESSDGVDADLQFVSETAENDIDFEHYFTGLLQLEGLEEEEDNIIEVPVIRDDFWSIFLRRWDTPVDLMSSIDLDGNEVDPVEPVTVNLTSQKVRMKYDATYGETTDFVQYNLNTNKYGIVDFGKEELSEISEKYTLPRVANQIPPTALFALKYGGEYEIDLFISSSTSQILGSTIDGEVDLLIKINNNAPIQATRNDIVDVDSFTTFEYTDTLSLNEGDTLSIYFWKNGSTVETQWGVLGASYLRITADTIYPNTTVEGFWIHDLFAYTLARIGLGEGSFYSEYLGSELTKARQYDSAGCGSRFFVTKGLFIRGYTLTTDPDDPVNRYTLQEKGFQISLKDIWDGINPILNLGLGYEKLEDSPQVQVIRIEELEHFYDDSETSIDFDFVQNIKRRYDKDKIFKSIKVGYKKGKPESVSGLDDPQKQTRATRFKKVGKEIDLESEFIATSLSWETTRRTRKEKSADYKFDNDNFILAINTDGESPDTSPEIYEPELDENFDSINNLLNASTRYNAILTPLRNFLRWANYISGCLQDYLTSSFKFVSGEGNYDLQTDYSCSTGQQCLAVICDEIAESDNISLETYGSTIGYIHLPLEYEINIPMSLSEYKVLVSLRKKAFGISRTDTNHVKFFIKDLDYDKVLGQTTILAWPKTYFDIEVVDQEVEMECGTDNSVTYDESVQDWIDIGTDLGYTPPSDEVLEIINDLVTELKDNQIWEDLDLLYIFAIDGDSDFATLNLVNPSLFQAQKINNPTFIPNTGFQGNGTDSYLDPTWNPIGNAIAYTRDEAGSFILIKNEVSNNNNIVFGASGSIAGQLHLMPKTSGGSTVHNFSLNGAGGNIGTSPVSSKGFFHQNRVDANEISLYKDGISVGTDLASTTDGLTSNDVYILAWNAAGTPVSHSNAQVSVFGIGASLSGKEVILNDIFSDYIASVDQLSAGGILLESGDFLLLESGDLLIKEN